MGPQKHNYAQVYVDGMMTTTSNNTYDYGDENDIEYNWNKYLKCLEFLCECGNNNKRSKCCACVRWAHCVATGIKMPTQSKGDTKTQTKLNDADFSYLQLFVLHEFSLSSFIFAIAFASMAKQPQFGVRVHVSTPRSTTMCRYIFGNHKCKYFCVVEREPDARRFQCNASKHGKYWRTQATKRRNNAARCVNFW